MSDLVVFEWWRRRESNPRPKTFHTDIYILIRSFGSRLSKLPSAGFLKGQPEKISLLPYRRPGSAIPLVDALTWSAGKTGEDGSLSSYSVGIIVCDYV